MIVTSWGQNVTICLSPSQQFTLVSLYPHTDRCPFVLGTTFYSKRFFLLLFSSILINIFSSNLVHSIRTQHVRLGKLVKKDPVAQTEGKVNLESGSLLKTWESFSCTKQRLHKLNRAANSNRKTGSLSIFPVVQLPLLSLLRFSKLVGGLHLMYNVDRLLPFLFGSGNLPGSVSCALFLIWCQFRKSESHSNLRTHLKTHSGKKWNKSYQYHPFMKNHKSWMGQTS